MFCENGGVQKEDGVFWGSESGNSERKQVEASTAHGERLLQGMGQEKNVKKKEGRGRWIAVLATVAVLAIDTGGCAFSTVSPQQQNDSGEEKENAGMEATQPSSTETAQPENSDGMTGREEETLPAADEEVNAVVVSKKTVYNEGDYELEEYNDDGTVLYKSYDKNGKLTTEYLADEEGNQFYRRSYNIGSLRSDELCTYDGKGKLLTQVYKDYLNPEYSTRTEYTYTTEGETARIQMYYTEEGYLYYDYEAVYSDGLITSIVERYADDETHEFTTETREEYQYNEHRDMTKMIVACYSLTDGSCLSSSETVYQNDYDSNGRLIYCREDMFGDSDAYPDQEKYTETTYVYDTDGNIVKNTWLFYRLDYYGNECKDYSEEETSYYADGTKAHTIGVYSSDYSWGSSWSRNESEYDQEGREVRYVMESEGQKTEGTYAYDEHGNEISWILNSSDEGCRERITNYEYDEYGNIVSETCNGIGYGYVTEYEYNYKTK